MQVRGNTLYMLYKFSGVARGGPGKLGPSPGKIGIVRNEGPVTGSMIHRVAKYREYKIRMPVLDFSSQSYPFAILSCF